MEHSRRAPGNVPEQDLMRAFDSKQDIAAILGRSENHVVVGQSLIGFVEVIPGKGGTITADQINPLAAGIEFSTYRGQEASTKIAVTLRDKARPIP